MIPEEIVGLLGQLPVVAIIVWFILRRDGDWRTYQTERDGAWRNYQAGREKEWRRYLDGRDQAWREFLDLRDQQAEAKHAQLCENYERLVGTLAPIVTANTEALAQFTLIAEVIRQLRQEWKQAEGG